jgi:hypothetical protein
MNFDPARLEALATCVLSHPDKDAADALRVFAQVVRVLALIPKDGTRLVIGNEDGEAFAAFDYPPPDDHGALFEEATPLAALLALAAATMTEPERTADGYGPTDGQGASPELDRPDRAEQDDASQGV